MSTHFWLSPNTIRRIISYLIRIFGIHDWDVSFLRYLGDIPLPWRSLRLHRNFGDYRLIVLVSPRQGWDIAISVAWILILCLCLIVDGRIIQTGVAIGLVMDLVLVINNHRLVVLNHIAQTVDIIPWCVAIVPGPLGVAPTPRLLLKLRPLVGVNLGILQDVEIGGQVAVDLEAALVLPEVVHNVPLQVWWCVIWGALVYNLGL